MVLKVICSVRKIYLEYWKLVENLLSRQHIPWFAQTIKNGHSFNGMYLCDWALFVAFFDILSEYFWNAEVGIGTWLTQFRSWRQRFGWWQINTAWDGGEKSRTICNRISGSANCLYICFFFEIYTRKTINEYIYHSFKYCKRTEMYIIEI